MTNSYYSAQLEAVADQTLAQCRKILARARKKKLFYGITALRLLHVQLPQPLENDKAIHVCCPDRRHITQMHDVRSHQWDCRYNTIVVDTVFGIECVNPVDAWMQCARKLDCDDLVALAEAIMHGDSYVDIDDFDMQALELPYRPFRGQRRCEEAFPQIRSDSDSLPETHLRLNLIHYGLPHPVVNYEPSGLTWTKNGPMKFDLAYPQQKLLIEYDGEHHQILHDQIDNDIEKRSRAVAAGWSVLTFNKHNFNQAPQLVDEFFLRTNTY